MRDNRWSYESLAKSLGIGSSSVFEGIKRAVHSRLVDSGAKKPRKKALAEFLIHGLKYAFPPERGSLVWGIPTGYAAAPLNQIIVQTSDIPPVWPSKVGHARGYSFLPLDKCAVTAAENDKSLYELLALVDAIRGGRARESAIAASLLQDSLGLRKTQRIEW